MKTIIKNQISPIARLVISVSFLVNLTSIEVSAMGKNVATDTVYSVPSSPEVSAYPNPVKETLTIVAPGQAEAHVLVSNSMGTSIWQGTLVNDGQKQWTQYNFENLDSGTYFIKIMQEDRVTVLRIVKQ